MADYEQKVRRGFWMGEKNGVTYMTIPMFSEAGFKKHCFTTRIGGVSRGVFDSLNLSMTREHNQENKKENYLRVCGALDVPYESLTLVRYAHGDGIVEAAAADAGKGISRQTDFPPCDAMIIREKGVTAVTLHADCVPVFIADPEKRVAGVCHAGWKGVLLGLPGKLTDAFIRNHASRSEDIIVGIGPHIMPCCFEVGEEVARPFAAAFGEKLVSRRGGGLFLDLQGAILSQMESRGVPAEQVTCADLCTYCRSDLFYSHRRDHGKTGAMGSFIALD